MASSHPRVSTKVTLTSNLIPEVNRDTLTMRERQQENNMSKIGRNTPCPCGSGKKYKKCCGQANSNELLPPDFEQIHRLMGASSAVIDEDELDKKFGKAQADLEAIFTAYAAEDIMLTLGISDLWIRNISSPIKHLFAFSVFSAIPLERFNPGSRISNYKTFCDVLERIHKLLPAFPMLEDYVPEADWGEVRSYWRGQMLRLFYGSSLEQVPDFIEAFRLTNANNPPALDDMYTAIILQDRILSSIDKSLVGDTSNISFGHIEIPSNTFWQVCRETLRQVGCNFSDHMQLSPELILDLGTFELSKSYSAFGNAVSSGQILQVLFIRIGDTLLPVAPRNAVINIIDFWGLRSRATPFQGERCLTQQVGDFLARRVNHRSISCGPCWVRNEHKRIETPFAAVLHSASYIYFVVTLSRKNLNRLPEIETELLDLISNSTNWGIQTNGASHGLQLHHGDGSRLRPEEIVVLAVLPQESTVENMIDPPKTQSAYILPIVDLVSIFDSIEDMAEFDRFFAYAKENQDVLLVGLFSLTDKFAAFRNSHGVLIGGAIQPDMVMIDPHIGSNWRYEELKRFWSAAPACFPDNDPRGWRIKPSKDGVWSFKSKAQPVQAWAVNVLECTLFFVYRLQLDLDRLGIEVLGLLAHCAADAIYRSRKDIETAKIFCRRRIIVEVKANPEALASGARHQHSETPLLQDWKRIAEDENDESVSIRVSVNLSYALAHFEEPADDRFEIDCACSIIDGIAMFLGEKLDAEVIPRMRSAKLGKPRFTLMQQNRVIDVPDFLNPQKPRPEMFKLARRDVAVIFKKNGIKPGRYEFDEAKRVIDIARDAFRDQLHRQIAHFKQRSVLAYCIAQNDAWTAGWDRKQDQLRHSLKHEVDYDRSQAFAEAKKESLDERRDLRFLLECCLSMQSTADIEPSEDDILQLLAHVDWLLVLCTASDVLHNELETGGIEIDDQFVPKVFYTAEREGQEAAFSKEQANYELGINLDPNANAMPLSTELETTLDKAFLKDVKISFSRLMGALSILMQWQSFHERSDFQLSYRATKAEIVESLCSFIDGIDKDEADNLTTFLTLYPNEIRRLIGKDVDEEDVPIWEHNKRGARYTIKPLVPIDQGLLMWGAASAQTARSIWAKNITNGFLPADYKFPTIREQVRTIKQALEKGLEHQAFEIISDYAPYVVQGIDFKRRFPKEKYDDVGDFDVLAYWPQEGKWLICECKYNQPPFCLKDAKRLRNRIFGTPPDHGQFTKIERRRIFLSENIDRLCELLEWPKSVLATPVSIDEVYISKEIYWWMRFPPYEVTTKFVRIDGLSTWISDFGYLPIK